MARSSEELMQRVKAQWSPETHKLADALGEKFSAQVIEHLKAERDAAYRGRAELISVIARAHEGAAFLVHGVDHEALDWPVLYVETWVGQLSWHINPGDLDLFQDIPRLQDGLNLWDGHTDEEKSRRLAAIKLHTRPQSHSKAPQAGTETS